MTMLGHSPALAHSSHARSSSAHLGVESMGNRHLGTALEAALEPLEESALASGLLWSVEGSPELVAAPGLTQWLLRSPEGSSEPQAASGRARREGLRRHEGGRFHRLVVPQLRRGPERPHAQRPLRLAQVAARIAVVQRRHAVPRL